MHFSKFRGTVWSECHVKVHVKCSDKHFVDCSVKNLRTRSVEYLKECSLKYSVKFLVGCFWLKYLYTAK